MPGLGREPWALAAALLVFGFGGGCLDVSMNAHAVHVQKACNRRRSGVGKPAPVARGRVAGERDAAQGQRRDRRPGGVGAAVRDAAAINKTLPGDVRLPGRPITDVGQSRRLRPHSVQRLNLQTYLTVLLQRVQQDSRPNDFVALSCEQAIGNDCSLIGYGPS